MAVSVRVDDERVTIDFTGIDKVMTLTGRVVLPMGQIASARVVPRREPQALLGWRLCGGYWPGLLATGWFLVRGRKGARQLWCVYRDPEVLLVETHLERPCRVVLQHPDRHDLAWWIGERLGRAHA